MRKRCGLSLYWGERRVMVRMGLPDLEVKGLMSMRNPWMEAKAFILGRTV